MRYGWKVSYWNGLLLASVAAAKQTHKITTGTPAVQIKRAWHHTIIDRTEVASRQLANEWDEVHQGAGYLAADQRIDELLGAARASPSHIPQSACCRSTVCCLACAALR